MSCESVAPSKLPLGFTLKDTLRNGEDGRATLVLAENDDEQEVVIKMIDIEQVRKEEGKKFVRREVVCQWRLRHHDSIVSFLDLKVTKSHVCIVMESGGPTNLEHRVMEEGCLEEDSARWLLQQITAALDYAHRMGVFNRDIKLENILVEKGNHKKPIIQLIDWGYSKTDSTSNPQGNTGTVGYKAPEVWSSCAQFAREGHEYDGRLADIFSSGACAFKMLYGVDADVKPSPILDINDAPENAPKNEILFPEERHKSGGGLLPPVSEDCKKFLTKLLQNNPTLRMEMDLIWEDPWFTKDLPHDCRASEKMIENHKNLNLSEDKRRKELIESVNTCDMGQSY